MAVGLLDAGVPELRLANRNRGRAEVVRADQIADAAAALGDALCFVVDASVTRAEIRGLTTDQIHANPRILLSPPPLSP